MREKDELVQIGRRSVYGLEKGRMSNDITTKYTKERNQSMGRKGYAMWKREKDTVISPKDYGMFLQRRRRK